MGHKKFALIALVILLVASVSACATDAGSTRGIGPSNSSGLPAPGMYDDGVQVFAQEVPIWEQVNIDGFGDPGTGEVTA